MRTQSSLISDYYSKRVTKQQVKELQTIHGLILITISILIFAVVLVRTAWLCDDSYITFRTIDNFINGYGLRWNVDERVQTFTNPLWMFLLSGIYFFTREIYYTSIFFSIAVSLGTIFLFAKISQSLLSFLTGITLLLFSKAFIDYSTSGLENPITHLLLGLFFFIFLKSKISFKTLFLLSFVASIGTFSRMDTILIFIPTIIYIFLKLPNKLKGVGIIILGFLPFILWELFSLFYYGFPFPNTYYAKLKTGVYPTIILKMGLYYFVASFRIDPLTLLTIIFSIIIVFLCKKWQNLVICFGIILYLLYIVKIGGDFMAGRFLTAPFFCSVIILSQFHFFLKKFILIFIITVFIGLFLSPHPPILSNADYGKKGCLGYGEIEDERAHYYPESGLLNAKRGIEMPNSKLKEDGKRIRKESPPVIVYPSVGYFGFFVGPKVYVLDLVGISNSLMARLPAKDKAYWRSGHIVRAIPYGLLKSLETGKNWIHDKDLAIYYDKLSLIVRGKLFDKERLKEILKMNMGRYNHLLNSYNNKSILEIDYSKIEPITNQKSFSIYDIFSFKEAGINIELKKRYHKSSIKVILDSNDTYKVSYFNKGRKLSDQTIKATSSLKNYFTTYTLDVPKEAVEKGYDRIRIIPLEGDGEYIMAHISLL